MALDSIFRLNLPKHRFDIFEYWRNSFVPPWGKLLGDFCLTEYHQMVYLLFQQNECSPVLFWGCIHSWAWVQSTHEALRLSHLHCAWQLYKRDESLPRFLLYASKQCLQIMSLVPSAVMFGTRWKQVVSLVGETYHGKRGSTASSARNRYHMHKIPAWLLSQHVKWSWLWS